MTTSLVLVVAVLLLAYANGANDNFKGVATLFGSATCDYRRALAVATVATLLGSLAALVAAKGLLAAFSGKGLVAATALADPAFLPAVAVGAAATILLATRIGMPVSTTHALVGALIGGGLAAGGGRPPCAPHPHLRRAAACQSRARPRRGGAALSVAA